MRRIWLLLLCLVCGFDWPGRVDRLLAQLERPSSEGVRRDLLRLLGASRDAKAVQALVRAVNDPMPSLRVEALRALGRSSEPAHVEAVRGALKDPDTSVRKAAVQALVPMHPVDAASLLTRSLSDSEPAVRAESARALGVVRDAQALPALAAALDDASTDVRVAAARALGALGDARGVGPLVGKARDGAPELREAVVDALHALDGPSAEGSSRATTVFAQGLVDPSDLVVFAAMRAVTSRGLTPWLASLHELSEGARPRVRAAAKALLEQHDRTLQQSAGDDWLPLLERTASTKPVAAEALLDALEAQLPAGEPLAADPLLAWLPLVPGELRPRVVRLIGRSGASDAARALASRLEGAPPALELAIVEALGELADAGSVTPLTARLAHGDRALREASALSLTKVAGPDQLPDLCQVVSQGPHSARVAALTVIGAVLARQKGSLPAPVEAQLLTTLTPLLQSEGELLFALATRSLGLLASEPAARALGSAETPSIERRLAVLRAASSLRTSAARALRMDHGEEPPEVLATALIARALAGDDLELERAATLVPGARWPVGPALAFALARASRPERARVLGPLLCALRLARDPWTRANALAGLARLPLERCADGDGARMLHGSRSESVRVAAAHWARARAGAVPALNAALARCARADASALVRDTCAGKEPAHRSNTTTRPGSSVCGLLLPDGSVLVSFPDRSLDPTWPHVGYTAVEMPWRAPYAQE